LSAKRGLFFAPCGAFFIWGGGRGEGVVTLPVVADKMGKRGGNTHIFTAALD
jgi:hypothetical protein